MGKIRIAEMTERLDISDSDLMIVEDDIDTKKTTVKELKRAFTGQEPDEYKFYTSKKTSELLTGLEIDISQAAKQSDIDDLKTQFSNVLKNATKDSEVIAARGTYNTLGERLDGDIKAAEKKYVQFPVIDLVGPNLDLDDFEHASIQITAPKYSAANTRIKIEGKNKFKYGENVWGAAGVSKVDGDSKAIKMTYTAVNAVFQIALVNQLPAGEYSLYAQHELSENFYAEDGFPIPTAFKVVHTDGSVTVFDNYAFKSSMHFNIGKPAKAIQFAPTASAIKNNMTLTLTNIVISHDHNLTRYYEFQDEYIAVPINTAKTVTKELDRCVVSRVAETNDALTGTLIVKGTDTSYTGNKIKSQFDQLYDTVYSKEDKCGMIVNKGKYIYAYNCIVNDVESQSELSLDYTKSRNGVPSVKVMFKEFSQRDNCRFTFVLNNPLDLSDARYISIQMYIDKTVSSNLCESQTKTSEAIRVMLSSDATIDSTPTNGNKKYFIIGNQSFVQGWNTIKIRLKDFIGGGSVIMENITQINFSITRNGAKADGMSFYINSVIIDQEIRPAVLLAFDDFDVNGFDDYLYKKLGGLNIPITIFANDKQTLTREFMANMAQKHYQDGWDLALYGCNPNKDLMISNENAWEQYVALKTSRDWFYEMFTSSVIGYAAPYDNMQPITEPILRELGFKIAKEDADQYISFFSKEDLVVPTRLLSNKEGCGSDVMIDRIREVVETGQALCICTAGVTRYGSEIAATTTSFEDVLNEIIKFRDRGQLEVLTFRDFYKQCVE